MLMKCIFVCCFLFQIAGEKIEDKSKLIGSANVKIGSEMLRFTNEHQQNIDGMSWIIF